MKFAATVTSLIVVCAMASSFAGVFLGQAVRQRMDAERFRRWFLIAMILLGLYLAATAIAKIYFA